MFSSLLGGKRVIHPPKFCALLGGVKKAVSHLAAGYHDAQGRHGGEFAPASIGGSILKPMASSIPEKFSASEFIKDNSPPKEKEGFSIGSKVEEGLKLASNHLSEHSFKQYLDKILELDKDIAAGKESYKIHSIGGKVERYTPERRKVHIDILKNVFGDIDKAIPYHGTPEFVIAGGLGGSGKSQFQEPHALEYSKDTHVILDSDKFKELLPDYDPEKAYLFHKEASHLLEIALRYARSRGANVALDSTMSSYKSKLLDAYERQGYKLRAVYMHVPVQEAVKRALSRWENNSSVDPERGKGRLVPAHVILGMTENGDNFDKIAKRVNSWSFYRNDNHGGAKAVKVADSNNHVVKQDVLFRSMLAK